MITLFRAIYTASLTKALFIKDIKSPTTKYEAGVLISKLMALMSEKIILMQAYKGYGAVPDYDEQENYDDGFDADMWCNDHDIGDRD